MFSLSMRSVDYQMIDNYFKLNSYNGHYAILYKDMLYFYNQINTWNVLK